MSPRKKRLSVMPMSMVAYTHAPLEDAELRVLGSATIDVVASVLAGHPLGGDLSKLRPDEVLIDWEPDTARTRFGPSSISARGSGFISIAFWLEDSVIVVRCRRLVIDAVVDSWVDRVRGNAVRDVADGEDEAGRRSRAAG